MCADSWEIQKPSLFGVFVKLHFSLRLATITLHFFSCEMEQSNAFVYSKVIATALCTLTQKKWVNVMDPSQKLNQIGWFNMIYLKKNYMCTDTAIKYIVIVKMIVQCIKIVNGRVFYNEYLHFVLTNPIFVHIPIKRQLAYCPKYACSTIARDYFVPRWIYSRHIIIKRWYVSNDVQCWDSNGDCMNTKKYC